MEYPEFQTGKFGRMESAHRLLPSGRGDLVLFTFSPGRLSLVSTVLYTLHEMNTNISITFLNNYILKWKLSLRRL